MEKTTPILFKWCAGIREKYEHGARTHWYTVSPQETEKKNVIQVVERELKNNNPNDGR